MGAAAFIVARGLATMGADLADALIPVDQRIRMLPTVLVLYEIAVVVAGILAGAAALRRLDFGVRVDGVVATLAAACGLMAPLILSVALTAEPPANPGRTALRLGLAVSGALVYALGRRSPLARGVVTGFGGTFAALVLMLPVANSLAVNTASLERLQGLQYTALAAASLVGGMLGAGSARSSTRARAVIVAAGIGGAALFAAVLLLVSLTVPVPSVRYDPFGLACLLLGAFPGALAFARRDAATEAWGFSPYA